MNILISACLLGENCKYNAIAKHYPEIEPLRNCPGITLIPICPEVAGGLSIPRDPAEQRGNQVVTDKGKNVTRQYDDGAREALDLAEKYHCQYAVLKERSPSCGSGEIYDGTFTHTKIVGDGVAAALLKTAQIQVIGESDAAAIARLVTLSENT